MFAILVPAALSPLIVTLAWAEHKARTLGLLPPPPHKPTVELEVGFFQASVVPRAGRAWKFAQQLDAVGLLLVGTSVALILLPLTLARSARGGWENRERLSFVLDGGHAG